MSDEHMFEELCVFLGRGLRHSYPYVSTLNMKYRTNMHITLSDDVICSRETPKLTQIKGQPTVQCPVNDKLLYIQTVHIGQTPTEQSNSYRLDVQHMLLTCIFWVLQFYSKLTLRDD